MPGFASLGATAKEAVRAWLQAPAEQWLRAEESERPWPMAITRVHPPPTDDSMDGSGATVRAIAAAATSAVPAPDAAAADDHGDGASTWYPPPRQRKRKRDYHEDAKESSHRQWKAFGSDPTRRSMKGIRTVRILHARAYYSRACSSRCTAATARIEGSIQRRGEHLHAMPFEIDARAWTEPMGAASNALLHDEGDAASAQDDALEVVPQMAAVAERGPKQVGMPLPVRRGAATTTTGERDDENELSDSSDSVDVGVKDVGVKDVGVKDVGVKDVGVKDVDDEIEGQTGTEGQMESEERGRGRGGRRKLVWRCARRGE